MPATGDFNIDLRPLNLMLKAVMAFELSRLLIDKTFTGDLMATSRSEMLSAVIIVAGSAGYVATEYT